MSLLPGPGGRRPAVLSGVLLAIAFPPFHLILPAFLGLAPLCVWLFSLDDTEADAREAGRGGFLFGLVYFGLLYHWMPVALTWFSPWAVPAYLSVVLILSWGTWAVCRVTHRLRHRGLRGLGRPLLPGWVAFALAWTALEWARAHVPGELAFPWLGLGHALTGFPLLVGAADLVGARGITLWLAAANALAASVWLDARQSGGGHEPLRRLRKHGLTLVMLVGIPITYGIVRARTLPMVPVGTVGVVQPDIPAELKLSPDRSVDSTLTSLRRLIDGPAPDTLRVRPFGRFAASDSITDPPLGPVILWAWPETAFLSWPELDSGLRSRTLSAAGRLGAPTGAPVLFGAIGADEPEDGPPIPHNSAFLATPGSASGVAADSDESSYRLSDYRYDKRRLVPMVERVPYLPVRWFGDEERHGGYGRGEEWPLGRTAGGEAFGVLVCYESSYPGLSRAWRREGARFLVNITNDAWFGREPWHTRTGALWQHPAHLVMRAIENRIGIVRAANTGTSFYVDPMGRVTQRTELWSPAKVVGQVLTVERAPLYTRVGDVAGWASALLVGLGWAATRRRERSG